MNKKEAEGHHAKGQGQYVITLDLGNKVKSLRNIGLKTPDAKHPIFKEFHDALVKLVKKSMPDVALRVIPMEELAEEIVTQAFKKSQALRNAIIVSTCVEIAAPSHGYTIEINRIVDKNGKIIGRGPRPGYPTIEDQINGIAETAKRQPLVLVEDGSFSGSTVCFVLRKFKEKNIKIAAVVLGFAFPDAIKAIRREFSGDIITIEEMGNLIDWMPDHDFVPFSPNCGRTFGTKVGEDIVPFYTHEGASYSIPYILPFSPMDSWTGIPKKMNEEISIACLSYAKDLFNLMDKLNGRTIMIGDMVGMRTRVSVPMKIGQKSFPKLMNTPVNSFLREIYKHGILHMD